MKNIVVTVINYIRRQCDENKKFIKLNKGLSIAVIVCMLFQISPFSFFFANKVFAGTGFRHQVLGDTEVVLGGNYRGRILIWEILHFKL
jgi:hypothetical protein